MIELYHKSSRDCSRAITHCYSTSFSLGIRMLGGDLRAPVYGIYGFVRLADEIVDTFHDHDKAALLARFREDTFRAISEKISLNPVLHSFQRVVHEFGIEPELITAFLKSMEMDLDATTFNRPGYEEYIFGSAEVVGLMCLRVFTRGDREQFDRLKAPARSLGSAFQKVNFLRDLKSDFEERGRVYFPGVDFQHFTPEAKSAIEQDIKNDFHEALAGIRRLPKGARFGVYVAYVYYLKLFEKIRHTPAAEVLGRRIRVGNFKKLYLLCRSAVAMPFQFRDGGSEKNLPKNRERLADFSHQISKS